MTAHAHERAHPVTISMTQSETQTSSEKMVSFNYAIVKMLALLCSYSPTLGAGAKVIVVYYVYTCCSIILGCR